MKRFSSSAESTTLRRNFGYFFFLWARTRSIECRRAVAAAPLYTPRDENNKRTEAARAKIKCRRSRIPLVTLSPRTRQRIIYRCRIVFTLSDVVGVYCIYYYYIYILLGRCARLARRLCKNRTWKRAPYRVSYRIVSRLPISCYNAAPRFGRLSANKKKKQSKKFRRKATRIVGPRRRTLHRENSTRCRNLHGGNITCASECFSYICSSNNTNHGTIVTDERQKSINDVGNLFGHIIRMKSILTIILLIICIILYQNHDPRDRDSTRAVQKVHNTIFLQIN